MNFFRLSKLAVLAAASLLIEACEINDPNAAPHLRKSGLREIPVSVSKWYNDYPSAASISFDINFESGHAREITRSLVAMGIRAEFELTSASYEQRPEAMKYLLDTLAPLGFGCFGHGREHVNHDALTYDSALASFQSNADFFRRYNLKPIAYAYPGGYGYESRTRKALKAAGFKCGRRFSYEDNAVDKALIMPDLETAPVDWFALPSIAMHLSGFGRYPFIKAHAQMSPIFEAASKRNAWICITYHTIGATAFDTSYSSEDWQADMSEIKKRDFWTAPMNTVVSYVLERNGTRVYAELEKKDGRDQVTIHVENEVEADLENQALTLKLEIPEDWVDLPLDVYRNGEFLTTSVFEAQSALLNVLPESGEYVLMPRMNMGTSPAPATLSAAGLGFQRQVL